MAQNEHINESILSDEVRQDMKKERIDHMTYLPGMEVLDSDIGQQVLDRTAAYDYNRYTAEDVRRALRHENRTLEDFGALLSPAALPLLEEIAQVAQQETRKHFGNSVCMFTPLYIANYCENYCIYCGFNCHNKIHRAQLNAEQIEKENIETESLSLLNVDEIPEDADALLIYAPASDISEEEADLLAAYVEAGGKLLAVAGPTEDGLPENLYSLLSIYGVSAQEGIVIEGNRGYYAFQSPYVLLPDMADADITASLIEENYMPILPLAAGLISTGGTTQATVTELLTTSDEAFSKVAGYDLTTYEKEDGDIDGPFALAVQVEINDGGEIIWFSSSSFLEDMYNAYSSGANGDLAMNALSALIGEREALSIRSKSLNYNFLTISESTASLLKAVMIGICPLGCLGIGILVVLRRRRNQNAPV